MSTLSASLSSAWSALLSRLPASVEPVLQQHGRLLLAGSLSAAAVYWLAFRRLGHDAGPPGSLFLAFGSRQRFPDVADLKYDPHYFPLDQEPWVAQLERDYAVVVDELKSYLATHGNTLQPFGHSHRMSSSHCWRVLSLMLWKVRDPLAQQHFPRTLALLNRCIPADRLVGITFSQLEPHSNIAPHYGDTNANYRCHLGLIIPRPLPEAGIEVGGEQRGWQEGKLVAFNDAHHHRAWNDAPAHRFILIIDVMRKEFVRDTNKVCCNVLASFVLQRLQNRWSWLKQGGKHMQHNVHALLQWVVAVPVVFGIGQNLVHRTMQG